MLLREYRICLPFSLEEFRVGRVFMVARGSLESTEAGEGIEVLDNSPAVVDGEYGRRTHKYGPFEWWIELSSWGSEMVVNVLSSSLVSFFFFFCWVWLSVVRHILAKQETSRTKALYPPCCCPLDLIPCHIFRRVHVGDQIPSWALRFLPADSLYIDEIGTTVYPHSMHTEYDSPLLGGLTVTVDTVVLGNDRGGTENALGLADDELASREVGLACAPEPKK